MVSSSARPAAHCISSDSSESEREEEEEKEEEGEERGRKDGEEEKEELMEGDEREDEASKEDELSSVTESGKGAGFSKSCKTGSFRYLNKNKGLLIVCIYFQLSFMLVCMPESTIPLYSQ